jgi:Arc/MetJ-type ribon-helix-helix transcriptional regulator
MIRTQIYLTKTEHTILRTLSTQTGRSQSELIRAAIDEMIERTQTTKRSQLLRIGRGLWKDREDLPDFVALREELDQRI